MLIGEIIGFGGSSAPQGFLICDGSAVSRVTYAQLFSKIGTSFGAGDGSTTFNVPDFRGRMAVGYDSGDASFDVIGETGGANTANLAHSHTQNAHTHSISGTTAGYGGDSGTDLGSTDSVASAGHTHTFSATSGTMSDPGTSSSLSSAQSILNPYITVNFVIRYKLFNGGSFLFNFIF